MPIGEILSLGSAIIWGFSVSLFKIIGNTTSPYILNPVKNTIGTILFLITCFIIGNNYFIYSLSVYEYLLIGLSGVIGITIADVLFLQSLNLSSIALCVLLFCKLRRSFNSSVNFVPQSFQT